MWRDVLHMLEHRPGAVLLMPRSGCSRFAGPLLRLDSSSKTWLPRMIFRVSDRGGGEASLGDILFDVAIGGLIQERDL